MPASDPKNARALAKPALPGRARVLIGRVPLDPVSFEEAVSWTIDSIKSRASRPPVRLSCPNASLIVLAQKEDDFASIISSSDLVVADGMPLLWAAAILRTPLRGQIRGVDLMEGICSAGAVLRMSFYILGALPGAATLAAQRLVSRFPGLRLTGIDCPDPGFEKDAAISRGIRERIAAAAPDFLIVALGSPKQESWIDRNYLELPVGAILGVGAAVDTYAGLRGRPPGWMRRIGLEWLGRLLREPRRLWRRYLIGNSHFLWIVFRQWLSRLLPG